MMAKAGHLLQIVEVVWVAKNIVDGAKRRNR